MNQKLVLAHYEDIQILNYKTKIILRTHSNVFTLENNNVITVNG